MHFFLKLSSCPTSFSLVCCKLSRVSVSSSRVLDKIQKIKFNFCLNQHQTIPYFDFTLQLKRRTTYDIQKTWQQKINQLGNWTGVNIFREEICQLEQSHDFCLSPLLTDSIWACNCALSSLNFSSSAFDASKFSKELDKLLSSSVKWVHEKNKVNNMQTTRTTHSTFENVAITDTSRLEGKGSLADYCLI